MAMRTTRITIERPGLVIHLDPRPVGDRRIHGRAHMWNIPVTGSPMKSRRTAFTVVMNNVAEHSPRSLPGLHDEHGHALPSANDLLQEIIRTAEWRRTAGCACGCSPGFILHNFPFDVYATWSD